MQKTTCIWDECLTVHVWSNTVKQFFFSPTLNINKQFSRCILCLLFAIESYIFSFCVYKYINSEYFTNQNPTIHAFRTILYFALSLKFVKHVFGSFLIDVYVTLFSPFFIFCHSHWLFTCFTFWHRLKVSCNL